MYGEFFSERLSRLRIEKGVSARDMSLSIGQSAGYINALENQRGYPSMQLFFYICDYLGISPSEFFDENNSHPVEYREIMKDLSCLEPEQLKHIWAIIKDLIRQGQH